MILNNSVLKVLEAKANHGNDAGRRWGRVATVNGQWEDTHSEDTHSLKDVPARP